MNDTSPLYLGLDLGGTKCALVTGTEDCRVLSRDEIRTADFPDWRDALDALLCRAPRGPFRAVGVSCGGPLDPSRGLILSPPNLPGWDDVPIVQTLEERLGAPAFLQNDANACALAEWRFGAGRGCRNMAFLTFGTGLGAGLDGPSGYGKRGSFEGFCSGGGIAQLAGMSAREAVQRADAGDGAMRAALRQSAEKLGLCLALLIDLLNPERIVIGSIYARAERYFRQDALRVVEREALRRSSAACQILPAQLGDAIGDYAALSVAIDGLAQKNVR